MHRHLHASFRLAGSLLLAAALAAAPVCAQGAPPDSQDPAPASLAAVPLPAAEGIFQPAIPSPAPEPAAAARRPLAISASLATYAAYGVVQALDVHSTLRALDNDAREANPLLRPVVSSPAGLVIVKSASTAGFVYLMERLRKTKPKTAIALALGVNALQTLVVLHNYRVARR